MNMKDSNYPYVITIASLVVIIAGIMAISQLVIPLLLSMLFAVILNPAVNTFSRYTKVGRGISSTIIVTLVVMLLIWTISALSTNITDLAYNSKDIVLKLEEQASNYIDLKVLNLSSIASSNFDFGAVLKSGIKVFSTLKDTASHIFVVFLMTTFMLCESESWKSKINTLLSHKRGKKSDTSNQIYTEIYTYISVKTLTSAMTGLCVAVCLNVLGHQYWITWGVLAMLLNYIPNVGSVFAAIPAVLVAFATMNTLDATLTIGVYLLVNGVIGAWLEPRLIGDSLGISALVIFVSMLFFGYVLGVVGMILSVPIIVFAITAIDTLEPDNKITVLLKS